MSYKAVAMWLCIPSDHKHSIAVPTGIVVNISPKQHKQNDRRLGNCKMWHGITALPLCWVRETFMCSMCDRVVCSGVAGMKITVD